MSESIFSRLSTLKVEIKRTVDSWEENTLVTDRGFRHELLLRLKIAYLSVALAHAAWEGNTPVTLSNASQVQHLTAELARLPARS